MYQFENLKMKIIFTFFLITHFCFGQNKSDDSFNESGALKTEMSSDCINVKGFADTDIKNNNIYILLQGGISPVVFPKDKIFEKNFNIRFHDQGCIGSRCSETYNQYIFDYLYKKYGTKWMKEIRKDVLGFKKWKKNHKNKQP